MEFNRESLSDCRKEVDEILRKEHWPELGHYEDIPIDMDWSRYEFMETANKLRCFIVRTHINEEFKDNMVIGYAFYFVSHHLHYKNTLVASQDILYIKKQHRGFGKSFIDWCDVQVKKEGVTTVTQHIKPWMNWGHMAKSLGYEEAEIIWSRRLD